MVQKCYTLLHKILLTLFFSILNKVLNFQAQILVLKTSKMF